MEDECERTTNYEIITLQVGNYSNYVGGHYFNLQDPSINPEAEVNPNVLWRQTRNQGRKAIWAPRVLTFDLKDNYSSETTTQFAESISDRSAALDIVTQGVLWQGDVKRVDFGQSSTSSAPRRNENQKELDETNKIRRRLTAGRRDEDEEQDKLRGRKGVTPAGRSESRQKSLRSSEVKSWVDFSPWKLRVPESSTFAVPNFSHNPTLGVVSNYGQGLQIYKALEEKVTDSIRLFAEACDYFQGFHILADQCDGFGGLASGILEHISDEYDKKTSFSFGLTRPDVTAGGNEQWSDFMLRTLNTVFCWNAFNLHSSVFTSLGLCTDLFRPNPVPIRLPHINYNPSSPFESSSLLAGALDTLTIPYRLKSAAMSLPEVASMLNAYGHKMTVIGSAFPFPLFNEATLFDTLNELGLSSLMMSLTPGAVLNLEKNIGNFFVTRGFRPDQVIRSEGREGREELFGKGITNARSCLEVYSQETCRKSVNVVRSAASPFKLSHPFPVLFDPKTVETIRKNVESRYSTAAAGRGVLQTDVWEMPTIASAHNASSSVGDLLQRMIDTQEKSKSVLRSGDFLQKTLDVEVDDYDDCINNLMALRETYLDY